MKDLEKDLDTQKEAYENDLTTVKGQLEAYKTQLRNESVKNQLLAIMPKETTIKKEQIITLFNSEHKIEEEDGKTYVVKSGERLKDPKSAEALTINTVFNEFLNKEGFVKGTPGRGGKDDLGGSDRDWETT